jgi:hypothetical protein
VALAGLLLSVLYGGLRAADVPILDSGRALIRELDPLLFERYAAPSPPEPTSGGVPAPLEREDRPDMSLDREVVAAMDQLDALFGGDSRAESPAAAADRRAPGASVTGIEAADPGGRFESVFGAAEAAVGVSLARPRTSAGRSVKGAGLQLSRRAPPPSALSGAGAGMPEMRVESATTTSRTEADEPDVPAVPDRSFDAEELDRSDVATLEDWIEAHGADLPVGVKVHLRYQPSFRTAVQRFRIGGRDIELYLMLNPAVDELHIVMVEGDRSVYLIDRGLRSEGRSLREGTVRRLDGEIVTVDSRSGAASNDRTREFYDIFLSWWEEERGKVRQDDRY